MKLDAIIKVAGLSSVRSSLNKTMHNAIRNANQMAKNNESAANIVYTGTKKLMDRTRLGHYKFLKKHDNVIDKSKSFNRIGNKSDTSMSNIERRLPDVPSEKEMKIIDDKLGRKFEKKFKEPRNNFFK